MPRTRPFVLSLVLLLWAVGADAQTPPKHEFRGAWVATVLNLDWPSSQTASTAAKKAELTRMLDSLKALGINAVLFQVRAESDAVYASPLEPWSYYLTGTQGRAPEPFFDPLQFAINEAHRRGMELHAWFNPFRAARPGSEYERAPGHVTNEHPEWLLQFDDGLQILNPGRPEVRDYVTRVVMDVVRRYDVDGVHFDDYFYPYPPNEMAAELRRSKDQETFAQYPRGFTDIEDWRRDNINSFVTQVHDSIQAVKPTAAFGISPFGIWKDGAPAGISGLSGYHTLYANARAWLRDRSVDYLAPQLYWGFGGEQDYTSLARWWGSQAAAENRHLYPGLAAYRAAPSQKHVPRPFNVRAAARPGAKAYGPTVVPQQVRLNQRRIDIQGSILFRSGFLTRRSLQGLPDSLRRTLYAHPALPPSFPWEETSPPPPPTQVSWSWDGPRNQRLRLQWTSASSDSSPTNRFAVYRLRSNSSPAPSTLTDDASHLLAITGRTTVTDRPRRAAAPYHYAVTAVGPNAGESPPSASVTASGRVPPAVDRFAMTGAAPNPFRNRTRIRMALPTVADVSVTVYDVLGRQVLQTRATLPPGPERTVALDGARLSAGVYLYRVRVQPRNGKRRVRTGKMVHLK
ncbi:hypothetical protein BSZ35_06110 [Salinibacter sp. 10B]|uniref:family 10 glycosylhydrolase n=1 Tax=Salinibacter sp. 10B TaxID=1923971 RepID=UPI000CF3E1F8|nr:family 10 glycosylhydrolase [Salinibacter sp. 10B]PQJ34232.1 hypothetical protein BSZ35_06110 [Salinibacter sp. 10B]